MSVLHQSQNHSEAGRRGRRNRDLVAEFTYLVVVMAVWIVLLMTGQLLGAVVWFMFTFFMFGIWRIARGHFRA